MALEMVPGFEIKAPLFLGCVTSDTCLNLRFFRTENGNDLHDRLGALVVMFWLSFFPALSVRLPLVIRARCPAWPQHRTLPLNWGRDDFQEGSGMLPGPPMGMA